MLKKNEHVDKRQGYHNVEVIENISKKNIARLLAFSENDVTLRKFYIS